MHDFEKLGAFYLGRRFDPTTRSVVDEPLLYDAKDLTTHGVCVGMTGSGKTGLCVSLIEEAAIDGVPTLAIDPKGDLGNLALRFPGLSAAEFRPWIDDGEAARKGRTPDEHAAATAETWRDGLQRWGQDAARVERLRAAASVTIYTPGSDAGRPVRLLRSFDVPPAAVLADGDALRELVSGTASGLLALIGVDADPVQSREHVLISTLVQRAWTAGRSLDLASLIREVQSPPIDRLGVLDLDTFFPTRERVALAMRLNGLVASPSFGAWMTGDPLDVQRLLWDDAGRPRISIMNIAHLSDTERMFFVTMLLNAVVSWVRAQPGTPSLRALLYMDEVFGFLPPTAEPPSKRPLLTLLKQARACGLGVLLTTQNPVDLDYKALSNAGTWMIGRLQTSRDVERLAAGLEAAQAHAAGEFDRGRLEATLAGLQGRVFLLNNVHDAQPVLFHTRWAMSYLRGPLTREQIRTLTAATAPPAKPSVGVGAAAPTAAGAARPVLDPGVEESFARCVRDPGPDRRLVYRPVPAASARLHFARARGGVDEWRTVHVVGSFDGGTDEPWRDAGLLAAAPELEDGPRAGATFEDLPVDAGRAATYRRWAKELTGELYRTRRLTIWSSKRPKAMSEPGEPEGAFRSRLVQLAREDRDRSVAKLEARYAPKLRRLEERIRTAEERVAREQSQYGQQKLQAAVSVGATVLGALFGRKVTSVGTVGRAATAVRSAGRAAREREQIGRAAAELERRTAELRELEEEFSEGVAELRAAPDPAEFELEANEIAPRKSDLAVDGPVLLWLPWAVGAAGAGGEPAFDLDEEAGG